MPIIIFKAVLYASFMVVHYSNWSRDGFRLPETTVGNARLVNV
ncbi:hypothetical protein [Nostoc sp. CmiVER01]|nr:hypothetical protein [Nostoc sp. CmiVER01]